MIERGILGWILVGLIVGVVGRFLMPGRDPGGFVVTILLGIAGALFGGFLFRAVMPGVTNVVAPYLGTVGGAVALIVLYRVVMRSRAQ